MKDKLNILVIDTATEACSVAVSTNNGNANQFEVCPQQQSQKLLPMVDEVLKSAKSDLSEMTLLAYGRGPGSFTGVRIATGMIQGLALGTGLPVVGVSTLAAMAYQVAQTEHSTRIGVAIDARMNEVYFAVYDYCDGELTELVKEQVCPPEIALSQLPDGVKHFAGTGWGAYDTLVEVTQNAVVTVMYPDAQYMLTLAASGYAKGLATAVEDVAPVYLRDTVTWKKLPGRE